jgi:hypothetical protein
VSFYTVAVVLNVGGSPDSRPLYVFEDIVTERLAEMEEYPSFIRGQLSFSCQLCMPRPPMLLSGQSGFHSVHVFNTTRGNGCVLAFNLRGPRSFGL